MAIGCKMKALGGGGYFKYTHATSVADIKMVNNNYKNDLTPDKKWIYPMPELWNSENIFNRGLVEEIVIDEFPKVSHTYFAYYISPLTHFTTFLPNAYWFDYTFSGCSKLESFDFGGRTFYPALLKYTFNNCKKLKTVNAIFGRKLIDCTGAFNGCILDKESVLRFATTAMPYPPSPITIGIHIDHQNDEEVLEALSLMETNGWVLTTQWNGTPTTSTASTFGLRRPVYAKLGIMELPDGTTEQILDWGHYVTNAEENGYQEFSSLDEAYKHFGLENKETTN